LAESKTNRSIEEVLKFADKKNPFPIYYLFGKDNFEINSKSQKLQEIFADLLVSDFDKEVFNFDKNSTLSDALFSAYAFPFGSEKKIVILNNFEFIDEKDELLPYIDSPQQSTILIITHFNSNLGKFKIYDSLRKKGYLFEASELKSAEYPKWVFNYFKQNGFLLTDENTNLILELVGENKNLIASHLPKFQDFLNGRTNITKEDIVTLIAKTKKYSAFDVIDAIAIGDKKKSLIIGNNLVQNTTDFVLLLGALNSFFTQTAFVLEFIKQKKSDNEIISVGGISYMQLKKIKMAKQFHNDKILRNVFSALMEADVKFKTGSMETKSLFYILISEIFNFNSVEQIHN